MRGILLERKVYHNIGEFTPLVVCIAGYKMPYLIFNNKSSTGAAGIKSEISLCCGIQESSIDTWQSESYELGIHDDEALSGKEMLAFICPIIFKKNVVIAYIDKDKAPLEKYLKAFGDDYIATISDTLNKFDMIDIIKGIRRSLTMATVGEIASSTGYITDIMSDNNINEDDIKKINSAYKKALKPFNKLIKKNMNKADDKLEPYLTNFRSFITYSLK